MKKLTSLTLMILLFMVGFSTVKADVYAYDIETYQDQGYDLTTGKFRSDLSLSSTDKLLIGSNLDSYELTLTNLNFHHLLFFDKNNRYIGYVNGNETSLELERYLGYDATASTPIPERAKSFVIQNYDYDNIRDQIVQTNTTLDSIAWGSYTYRDIFGDSLHSTGKNNLIDNGDFTIDTNADGLADQWSITYATYDLVDDIQNIYYDNTNAFYLLLNGSDFDSNGVHYIYYDLDTNSDSLKSEYRNETVYLTIDSNLTAGSYSYLIDDEEEDFLRFRFIDFSPDLNDEFNINEIGLYNLTDIFGSTYPTVEEMDQLLVEYKEISSAPATVTYRDVYDNTVNEYENYQADFAYQYFSKGKNLIDFYGSWLFAPAPVYDGVEYSTYLGEDVLSVPSQGGSAFEINPIMITSGETYKVSFRAGKEVTNDSQQYIGIKFGNSVEHTYSTAPFSTVTYNNTDQTMNDHVVTFTATSDFTIDEIYFFTYSSSVTTFHFAINTFQFEQGSTVTDYEAYNPVTVEDFGTITGQSFVQDYGVQIVNSLNINSLVTSSVDVDWLSVYKPLDSYYYGTYTSLNTKYIHESYGNGIYDGGWFITNNIGYVAIGVATDYYALVFEKGKYATLQEAINDNSGLGFVYETHDTITHTDKFYLDHDSESFVNLSSIYGEYDEPSNETYTSHFAVYFDPYGNYYTSYYNDTQLNLIDVSYNYTTSGYEPDVDNGIDAGLNAINMNTDSGKVFLSITILISVVLLTGLLSRNALVTVIVTGVTFILLTFLGWIATWVLVVATILLIIFGLLRASSLGGGGKQ